MKGKGDEGGLKRAPNGSAYIRCENCNTDVAAAIADMHDCGNDKMMKTRLQNNVVKTVTQEAPKAKKSSEEGKKKRASKGKKSKEPAKKKAKKDPNKPKKPQTGFFLFMEDFRKEKKAANITMKGSEITKLGGERWKEMSDEDKAPYLQRSAELKAGYEVAMKKYNAGETEGEEADEAEAKEGEEAEAEEGGEAEEAEEEAEAEEDA